MRERAVGVLMAVLACLPAAAHASDRLQFTGTAHDLATGKVVYIEHYDVQVDGHRWVSGTTRYTTPDGKTIATRRFDFSRDRHVPVYSLDQTNVDYHEGITRVDGKGVEVYVERDGAREAATLAKAASMVADCGSQPFLVDHADALAKGHILPFTLAVPGKTDSYKLRVRRLDTVERDGRPLMRLRIELDNVLRLVLPTLEVLMDPATKRLVEYSGIANIKDPTTQKAYRARVVFNYP